MGDLVCFYVAGKHQVVAYGRIAGELTTRVEPHEWPGPTVPSAEMYKVPLDNIVWLTPPVEIDAALRARLDAFATKLPTSGWSWLVQTTHRVSSDDFLRLTARA